MRVEFLGTGGYHPNERRHTACILLPEIGLMFDAGTSAFRVAGRLQRPELDIFLSHAHLDHIAGLTFLLPSLLDGTIGRGRVYASAATLAAVREHLFAEAIFPVEPPFEYVELPAEVAVANGGLLRHTPLNHPGGSVGYRIDWPDRSLAYITDTVADGTYREFLAGVDLLIHECYFPDARSELAVRTGHSHTTPVAELARECGAKSLVLLHFDPLDASEDPIGLDVARAIFPAARLAEDGLIVEL